MQDWADYVSRFYSLPQEQQQAEWEKLTPDQRKQFEAARASSMATSGLPQVSTPLSRPPLSAKAFAIRCALIATFFLLLFSGLALVANLEKRKAQVLAQEAARQEAEEQQAGIDYYHQNSAEIVAEANALLVAGHFQEVIDLTTRYSPFENPELMALQEKAVKKLAGVERQEKIRAILAEIKGLPETHVVKIRNLYRQLVELDPEEPLHADKLRFYTAKVDEGVTRSRQEQNRDQEERDRRAKESQARVAKFGEAPEVHFDGSYLEVVEYLRQVAHDPVSITIDDCTDVRFTKEGWLVGCKYRGLNTFGAMVLQLNWFTIRQGRVVEVHPASAYDP